MASQKVPEAGLGATAQEGRSGKAAGVAGDGKQVQAGRSGKAGDRKQVQVAKIISSLILCALVLLY